MRIRTVKPISGVVGILACVALIMVAVPADGRSEFNRSINLAARQWLLVEQMTNGAMLAVLGIDTERNVHEVRSARDLFSRSMRGLRSGDAELGLTATTTPEVVSELSRVEAFWPRYDQTLQAILTSLSASSEVSERRIRELSDIHALMIEAVGQAADAFEEFSHGGDAHSILSTTLNGSGQLRTNSQLMLGELIAIAYHADEGQNRQQLGRATREFDRTLTGLIQGDPELRLLPAPNDQIRAELAKIQRLWSEIQPILDRVAAGGNVDQQSITMVSRYTGRMIAPLNLASLMYENL